MSEYNSLLIKPYFLNTAFPLFKQLATSIHAIKYTNNNITRISYIKLNPKLSFKYRYSRKDLILSQNKTDAVSQPRKNSEKYLRLYTAFGIDLIINLIKYFN